MMHIEGSKSGLTGWVLAIMRAMRACDIAVEPVMAEIGMDPTLLEGGYSRYSQEQISRLWRKAIELSGDHDFALRVAAEIRPSTFHVVGYAMSCSATLGRALDRFARYSRLISDSATATMTATDNVVALELLFDTGGDPLISQTIDTVLAGTLSFSRWIVGEQLQPWEVHLQHGKPDDDYGYRAFFQAPIIYDSARNALVFRKVDLDRPILAADEELASMLDSVANRYLEKRMSGRMAVRVRDLLIGSLPNGAVSKTDVASLLNLTERTLLRRLKAEGTTFVDVLNGVRQELAFQYLRRPGVTICDVAYLLGFSDENTFSRAFKRWTGRRPSLVARGLNEPPERKTA